MGDVVDAQERLLASDGIDYGRLTEVEQEAKDISRLSYTEHNRRVIRRYEGAAKLDKILCKFLQDENHVYACVLYHFRLVIKNMSVLTVYIYANILCMDRMKDLRNRGEKTVLVKKSDVVVDTDEAKNYTNVECMEPCVDKYCNLYTTDLSERLGLDKVVLGSYLTIPVLLNPMSGVEKRMVCLCLINFVLKLTFHETISGDCPNHLVTTNALLKRLHNVIGNFTIC